MKRSSVLFLVALHCASYHSLFAQKEAAMWYFGQNAGLDFNSGSPVAFSGSAMNQLEGCASIADTSGTTMFYTDGATVWNRNNTQMPNGFGLLGDNNSAQSAIIVPAPGSSTLYYIFTTPTWGIGDMCYSIVDMSLQAGLGDVTTKNTPMFTNSTEKVTAIYHANGNDIWIVGHEFNTNNFYSFLLTNAGVNPVPVITSVGTVHATTLGFAGYMKGAHSGNKIACACTINMNLVEVFDFDNSTGIPSNAISFPGISEAYGLEFSPDDTKLYATEENPSLIIQWDLSAGSPAAIIASQTVVGNTLSTYPCGALQLGPDGKIYLAKRMNVPDLGVINDPDQTGLACNFIDQQVILAPGTSSMYGLPNFFQGLFYTSPSLPVAVFTAPNHICPGTCTDFINLSTNATSFLWSFAGANPSVSTDISPVNICYNSPGTYSVQLIATNANGSDTLTLNNFVTVYPYPPPQGINQSGDTLIANPGAVSYQWYHDGLIIAGATDYFYVAAEGGNYNVVATDANGCEVEAVIFDVVAGLSQAQSNPGSISCYPNPACNTLRIESGQLTINTMSIYDLLGKLKYVKDASGLAVSARGDLPVEIDVRSLSPGMYWIEIKSDDKKTFLKFIKQ